MSEGRSLPNLPVKLNMQIAKEVPGRKATDYVAVLEVTTNGKSRKGAQKCCKEVRRPFFSSSCLTQDRPTLC